MALACDIHGRKSSMVRKVSMGRRTSTSRKASILSDQLVGYTYIQRFLVMYNNHHFRTYSRMVVSLYYQCITDHFILSFVIYRLSKKIEYKV